MLNYKNVLDYYFNINKQIYIAFPLFEDGKRKCFKIQLSQSISNLSILRINLTTLKKLARSTDRVCQRWLCNCN